MAPVKMQIDTEAFERCKESLTEFVKILDLSISPLWDQFMELITKSLEEWAEQEVLLEGHEELRDMDFSITELRTLILYSDKDTRSVPIGILNMNEDLPSAAAILRILERGDDYDMDEILPKRTVTPRIRKTPRLPKPQSVFLNNRKFLQNRRKL